MTILEALKLPDPAALASEFGCRGFVRVPKLLDRDHVSKLFDLATRLLRQHGVAVDRDGGAQSLGHRLRYEVVTGDRIKADGGMLFSMYAHHDLLSWLRILTNAPVLDVSPHLRSAININCLSKAGHQYPWHQDA